MLITTLLKDMEKTKRNAFILFAVAGVALAVGVAEVRRSSTISSVNGWGDGLSSLDDDLSATEEDPYIPLKCMFARESRVKNGQRVSVILLEDIMVGGIPVPKNTHLMARCKLSDRLELEFENIEI